MIHIAENLCIKGFNSNHSCISLIFPCSRNTQEGFIEKLQLKIISFQKCKHINIIYTSDKACESNVVNHSKLPLIYYATYNALIFNLFVHIVAESWQYSFLQAPGCYLTKQLRLVNLWRRIGNPLYPYNVLPGLHLVSHCSRQTAQFAAVHPSGGNSAIICPNPNYTGRRPLDWIMKMIWKGLVFSLLY